MRHATEDDDQWQRGLRHTEKMTSSHCIPRHATRMTSKFQLHEMLGIANDILRTDSNGKQADIFVPTKISPDYSHLFPTILDRGWCLGGEKDFGASS